MWERDASKGSALYRRQRGLHCAWCRRCRGLGRRSIVAVPVSCRPGCIICVSVALGSKQLRVVYEWCLACARRALRCAQSNDIARLCKCQRGEREHDFGSVAQAGHDVGIAQRLSGGRQTWSCCVLVRSHDRVATKQAAVLAAVTWQISDQNL